MRGARLLQCLLLLQNRGRMTSAALAEELEVSQRTILRDLDAMTEAGLPIIVHRGAMGGIELGFDYRTRLTALTEDEAEALGLMLARPSNAFPALELAQSARRAASKVIEAQSPKIRTLINQAQTRFKIAPQGVVDEDPRVSAMARAVRQGNIVILAHLGKSPTTIHPVGLFLSADGAWAVRCGRTGQDHPRRDWADIAVSAKTFAPEV